MTPMPKPIRKDCSRPKPVARRVRLKRGVPPKRTSRPRQQRKGERAAMRREAWRLLSLIVRTKEPVCRACVRRPSTDGAHIFGRRHESVRLCEANVLALCRPCHTLLGSASLVRLTEMEMFARRLMGDAAFGRLRVLAVQLRKFRPETLDVIRAQAVSLGIKVKAIPEREIPP